MKFFVSYARNIQDSVREMVDALRDGRADVWWDQDLRAGQDWWASILDQVEACDVFIFLISERSVQSPYCMAELRYALARNRLVLPFVVDAGSTYVIPPELTRIQRETYKNNPTHFVNRLGITCRDINWAQYKDRYAPRPSEPNANSEDIVDQLDKALSMAAEGYFEEALQILNAVMHYAYAEYGTFCGGWIEKVQMYREIAKLAQRPAMRHLAFPKWETFVQQYGEDFDPLGIRPLFVASEPPPTQPSRPQPSHNTKVAGKFDVYEAIMHFQAACDNQEWEVAQQILQVIRASGAKLPAVFDLEANERELQRCLNEEVRNKDYHLIRSMLKMKKPNYKLIYEALQTFWDKYPDYDPDQLASSRDLFAHIWLEAADTYEEHDHANRLKSYDGAIHLKPDFVEAYVGRGSFYYSVGDYELASGDFTTAIQLNPHDGDSYYYRAFSYASQNLREMAIKDFKTVLKLDLKHRHAEGIPKLIEMLSKKRDARQEA